MDESGRVAAVVASYSAGDPQAMHHVIMAVLSSRCQLLRR
jgi:hypothetical protein